ncbi:MAG: PKD domain-containing protein [Candidatus Kapaibacterium sp.]
MKYIIFSLLLLSFSALHAQNGWKDMGGYKETTDTTGEVLQIKPTTDGKYLYVLCTLMDSTVKKPAIQKWDVDSGRVVLTRFIDMKGYATVARINLNCDASSYTIYGSLSNEQKPRFRVIDLETETPIVSITDPSPTNQAIVQIDYDRVLKCFYVAANGTYVSQNGPNYKYYSNGSISKKTITNDSLITTAIVSPNTEKFIHLFGTTILTAISFFESLERIEQNLNTITINNKRINFIGVSQSKGIKLLEYPYAIPSPKALLALSPNGMFVTHSTPETIFSWYVDSLLQSSDLGYFSKYATSIVYSRNSRYLLINSPKDSSIYTINPFMHARCGVVQSPITTLIREMFTLPSSTSIIAYCSDGKFRMIDAIVDTAQPKYTFTADKSSIYQHNAVSFYSIIPSFDSSTVEWDFGDGKKSSYLQTTHIFDSAGIFDITMKVTDKDGVHTTTISKMIEVKQTLIPITLDFDADVRYGSAPLKVNFTNKSTGTIVSYKWSFDDGTTSSAKDTVHTFKQQRSYSITLTVNNGIKDTSLTKYHYINAEEYPAFLLNTKLTKNIVGSNSRVDRYTDINTNVFETMFRSSSGTPYIKLSKYLNQYGTYPGGMAFSQCRINVDIYSLKQDGNFDKGLAGIVGDFNSNIDYCASGNGTLGLLRGELLTYFTPFDNHYEWRAYLLNTNSGNKLLNPLKYKSNYEVRSLNNGIDCYSFRNSRALKADVSYLCFYKDTTTLLKNDTILGYALPAIETPTGTMLTVVSQPLKDTSGTTLQLRWYDNDGQFIESKFIKRNQYEFILDIVRMPNNKYLLCGSTGYFDSLLRYHDRALLLIMDENGTVEYRKDVPAWKIFKRITRMDDNTYALTGTPFITYPGFLAVKSDGKIVGDFRADVTAGSTNAYQYYNEGECPTCVNTTFGKTMRTVFFTRNDGYNAELYVSDNPYLQDISVSVDESPVTGRMIENQLTVSPNPTDGNSTLHYYSTTPQRITLTVTSLLGEVYLSKVMDVESGENTIPLDMTGFGSGVAFVTVAGMRDVQHAQIHILR